MNVLKYEVIDECGTNAEDPANETTAPRLKLTTFLRWAGVLLILFSALGFMLQGYADVGPQLRYWLGLILTLSLASGGLLCAHVLRETTGTRIFFGLAVLFLIVQSSQVGAMLIGWLHPATGPDTSYRWLLFSGVRGTWVLLDVTLTATILGMIGYAGFSTLARRRSKMLLGAFMIGNLALWIPVREAFVVSLMMIGLFILLRGKELVLLGDFTMQTWEGRAARALLFVPLLVLAGRQSLYQAGTVSMATVLGLASFFLLWDCRHYLKSRTQIFLGEITGMTFVFLAWVLDYGEVIDTIPWLSGSIATFMVPAGWIWLALSFKTQTGAIYRNLAAVVTIAALVWGNAPGTVVLVAGMVWTAAGIQCREKVALISGMIGIMAGSIDYLKGLIGLYTQAPWMSSAILGFTVILLASWIEKQNWPLIQRAKQAWREIRAW